MGEVSVPGSKVPVEGGIIAILLFRLDRDKGEEKGNQWFLWNSSYIGLVKRGFVNVNYERNGIEHTWIFQFLSSQEVFS